MFSSLTFRDFRLLWFGNIAATFAMQMQMVARGWLIYDMTASPMALTWVMLSFMLPSVVFSLVGGVIADRRRKRSIMIVSGMLNTVATAALAAIVYAGDVTFWHFIYFGLFNGTVLALSMPARASVTPEIVGRDQVVNAMALQSATFNLSRIVGPTLAGGLIAIFAAGDTSSAEGVGIVIFTVAALYLVSVICTALIHYQGDPHKQGASPLADVKEGFRFMREERIVLGLLVMGFVPMTFGFSVTFLMPAFNADVILGGPDTLGLLMTSAGAGALGGSLLLARAGDIGGKGRVMFYAGFLWAIFVGAFALSGNLIANAKGYVLKSAKASIGESQMQASIVIETNLAKPLWTINLKSQQIQLKDFTFEDWSIEQTETHQERTAKQAINNKTYFEPLRRLQEGEDAQALR